MLKQPVLAIDETDFHQTPHDKGSMLQKAFGLLFAIGLIAVAGVAGGLMYGLLVDPIRYTDVDPQDLSLPYQGDYITLIAADYAQTGNLSTAEQRLNQMGFSAQTVASRAQVALSTRDPLAAAMAKLATDLGAGNPGFSEALATPSATLPPRFTATPTATSTPTRTRLPTRTPRATVTATATATASPVSTIE